MLVHIFSRETCPIHGLSMQVSCFYLLDTKFTDLDTEGCSTSVLPSGLVSSLEHLYVSKILWLKIRNC